ncbi:MAG: efflux RND transporter periplasmic adaptor subunit [Bacteroidota bacterium]
MKGNKFWIYSLIITGIVLATVFIFNQGVEMETMTVASGPIAETVEDTGTVKSRNSRTVYLETPGRIIEILVDKGDLIQKGDLLLKLDPTDQQLTQIALHQAQNDYDLAQKDYEKIKQLYTAGAVSRKEYETAERACKNARETYEAAHLSLEKSTESTLLRAPRAGMVLDKLVEPNLYAPQGTAAFVIGNLSDLEIEAEILADEAVNIRPGNPVVITGNAAGGRELKGTVAEVSPIAKNIISSLGINQKRRLITIALTGETGQLKPGVDIDVKIITKLKPNAIKVPLSAIFDRQGQTCVFVVKNGVAKIRQVDIKIENDEEVEIGAGLKPGEIIIVRPDNDLKEGTKIKFAADK